MTSFVMRAVSHEAWSALIWIGDRAYELMRVDEHGRRVSELLANNNRSLQEARDARSDLRRARLEADALWSRSLQLEATLRRIDPAWRG